MQRFVFWSLFFCLNIYPEGGRGEFYLDCAALQVHGSRLFCPFLRGLRCHHTDEWQASQSDITANVTTGHLSWGFFSLCSKYCAVDLSTKIFRRNNADGAVFSEISNFLWTILELITFSQKKTEYVYQSQYVEHQLQRSFNTQYDIHWVSTDVSLNSLFLAK